MTSSQDAEAAAKKAAAAERKRKRLEAWRKRQKEKEEEVVPPKKKVTMSLGLSLKRKKADVSNSDNNNNNKPKKKKKKRTIEFSDFNEEDKPDKSFKTHQEMEEELNTTATTATNTTTISKEKSSTTSNSSAGNNRKKRNRWDATPKPLETVEKQKEAGSGDALDSFMEKLEAGAMGSVAMQNKLEVLKVDVGGSMMNLPSKKTPMASPLTGGVITAEDLARINQSSKQKDGAIFTASDWESDNVNNDIESSSEVSL